MTGQGDRPMTLLNVKVSEALRELVDKAVQVSGAHNRSDWVREALQAGATRELEAYRTLRGRTPTDEEAPTQPPSRSATLGVQRSAIGRVRPSGCQHPPTARWIGVESETCTLCGVVVKRRI